MANPEHLAILKQGVEAWNAWRKAHPKIHPNLRGADLSNLDLAQANLKSAHLTGVDLTEADLSGANLTGAALSRACLDDSILHGAILYKAKLERSTARSALFRWADLSRADLTEANLTGADLRRTHLSKTIFKKADLSGSKVYGIAAWNLQLDGAVQTDLIITEQDEPVVTIDNIEVAQFIYLLLNNEKIRDVIETVTSKVVLILGRFSSKRKAVLDAIREELRKDEYDYVPVVFDFDKPASRDLEETITLLARMARFIIADITNAKSIPQELAVIVRDLPSVPVQPILRKGARPWAMFGRIRRYPWVLPMVRYVSRKELLPKIGEKVVRPAEDMVARQRSSVDT